MTDVIDFLLPNGTDHIRRLGARNMASSLCGTSCRLTFDLSGPP